VSDWSDAVSAQLDGMYEQVPDAGCRGLCVDACGPIDMGPGERHRLVALGMKIPRRHAAIKQMIDEGGYTCPALVDGRCSVYASRPMICRVWGVAEDLRCPYGCEPANGRVLRRGEALALLDAATKAGTPEAPWTAEQMDEALHKPGVMDVYRGLMQRSPVQGTPPS
jgi:Fe-S-cluster containining protein